MGPVPDLSGQAGRGEGLVFVVYGPEQLDGAMALVIRQSVTAHEANHQPDRRRHIKEALSGPYIVEHKIPAIHKIDNLLSIW